MDDNVRPQRPRAGTQFLHENAVDTIIWPDMSLYRNPIEHLWDNLGHRIQQRPTCPDSQWIDFCFTWRKKYDSSEWIPKMYPHYIILLLAMFLLIPYDIDIFDTVHAQVH